MKRKLLFGSLLFVSSLFLSAITSNTAMAQNDSVIVIGSDGKAASTLIPNLNTPRGTALDQENGLFFVSEAGAGQVLRVDLNSGVVDSFVTGVAPFDLEIDPASGDLFISDANQGIIRTPTDVANVSVVTSDFVPSGLGFAPNGSLFAGAQVTSPNGAGLFEVAFDANGAATATQVGNVVQPFDVQVDSLGNVFANNGNLADVGEIAVFPLLGAGDNSNLATVIDSESFSAAPIRGLAIGPNDEVFATTGALTIVEFEPLFDLDTIDPATNLGSIFAGPPVGDVGNPFAFDILFADADGGFPDGIVGADGSSFVVILSSDELVAAVPEPASATLLFLGGAVVLLRRRNRA